MNQTEGHGVTFWNTPFGNLLLTFFISMVPIVELRAAIPFAVARDVNIWWAFAAAFAGNMLPVPFIILFVRRIFAWLRKKAGWLDRFITKLETRAAKKSDLVQRFSFLGLYLLVAIPLPGTGAWTGSLVAAMLDMRLKRAVPAVALGVLTAGIIMIMASLGVDILFFR